LSQKVFLHTHPYPPFLFKEATKLIVGTLPPPRFTTGDLEPGDVDFCYGSKNGQLWRILDRIFNLNLVYENTALAIKQRRDFLKSRNIGICDIIESAERYKIDASDLGLHNIKLRKLLDYLQIYPMVDTLIFTGGNSKNGPEYLFRKQLKNSNISYELVSDVIPRIHSFQISGKMPNSTRLIRTVSLTAPSGSANRAIGSMDTYKSFKAADKNFNTFDFRVLQYKNYF